MTTKTKSTSTDLALPERRQIPNPRGTGVLNRSGRPKGATNVFNTQVKEAIVEAASRLGSDGKGKGGLVGYLRSIASDPKTKGQFATLLGRVIPYQVAGDPTRPFIVYITENDAKVG